MSWRIKSYKGDTETFQSQINGLKEEVEFVRNELNSLKYPVSVGEFYKLPAGFCPDYMSCYLNPIIVEIIKLNLDSTVDVLYRNQISKQITVISHVARCNFNPTCKLNNINNNKYKRGRRNVK